MAECLHDYTARVLLLCLCIEHFTLRAQTIRLCNQTVNLFSTLEHALDGLVQHNLCLVELLLDLHDAIGCFWRLIRDNVFFEDGKLYRFLAVGPFRVACREFTGYLGEELVSYQSGIFLVGDYLCDETLVVVGVESIVLFFDVLALAFGLGPVCYCDCKEFEKLADAGLVSFLRAVNDA